MQLIGGQGQDAFSVSLCGIAAFPALPAELFECEVQVFNRVFSLSGECFWAAGRLGGSGFACREYAHGTRLPLMT